MARRSPRRLTALGHQAPAGAASDRAILEGGPLELAGTQAVLLTSANGVRALARRTPIAVPAIFAVGRKARTGGAKVGFLRVQSADGDAAALAEAVARWADPPRGRSAARRGRRGERRLV